ncbi:MAG: hypoxanthine phosphoribosyltransferase, partial [Bacteroidales bacterium]|nr:hypoxanthine phosphoribosyltransferase [Bacteroidales bacterium]
MERIQLHDKYFKPFIPNSRIEEAIDKVAEKLNNDYSNEDTPVFLSVLNGSFMFTASLMGRLKFNCEISFVKLASYTGTESSGCIN